MSWVRIDDNMPTHPKALQVGREGLGVWVAATAWSSLHGTDGMVPEFALPAILLDCKPAVVKRLVDAGLWEEREGGYYIHDYLDYQPPASKRAAKRDAARERMQRARSQCVRANTARTPREPSAKCARSAPNPDPDPKPEPLDLEPPPRPPTVEDVGPPGGGGGGGREQERLPQLPDDFVRLWVEGTGTPRKPGRAPTVFQEQKLRELLRDFPAEAVELRLREWLLRGGRDMAALREGLEQGWDAPAVAVTPDDPELTVDPIPVAGAIPCELWAVAREQLHDRFTEQAWRKDLQHVAALELTDDRLVLGAPGKYRRDWLVDHYLAIIAEAVDRVAGRPLEVRIVAVGEAAA